MKLIEVDFLWLNENLTVVMDNMKQIMDEKKVQIKKDIDRDIQG